MWARSTTVNGRAAPGGPSCHRACPEPGHFIRRGILDRGLSGRCQDAEDFQDLPGVLPKMDVDTLHSNRATGVDDDEPHLRHSHHASHCLARLREHVVLATDL